MVGHSTIVAVFQQVMAARAENLFMHLRLEGGTDGAGHHLQLADVADCDLVRWPFVCEEKHR